MLLLLLQALLLNSNEVSALLGSLAPITVRPFHVSIYLKSSMKPWCGGCIISIRSALTAAHCFRDDTADDLLLRAGYDNLDAPIEDRDWYNIQTFIRHSGFDTDPLLKWEHDIAIVFPVKDFVLGAFIHPIPMSTELPDPGHIAFVSTYTTPDRGLTENSTVLVVKDLQTWNHDRCQELLTNMTIEMKIELPRVSTTQFCATDPNDFEYGCIVDSGGPITTMIAGGKLLGIASWVAGCGYKGTITFYSSVAAYADWIEEATKRYA